MLLYGKAITLERRGKRKTFISQLTQATTISPYLWNKAPPVLQDICHSTLDGILSRRRVLSVKKNDNFLLQAMDIDAHSSACLLKGLFFPSSSRYQWMLYATKPLRFRCWLHQYQWLLQLYMSKRVHWKWQALRRCDPYFILSSHWILRMWILTLFVRFMAK